MTKDKQSVISVEKADEMETLFSEMRDNKELPYALEDAARTVYATYNAAYKIAKQVTGSVDINSLQGIAYSLYEKIEHGHFHMQRVEEAMAHEDFDDECECDDCAVDSVMSEQPKTPTSKNN